MKFIQLALALSGAALAAAQRTTGCSAAVSAIPTCGVCISSRPSINQYVTDSHIQKDPLHYLSSLSGWLRVNRLRMPMLQFSILRH